MASLCETHFVERFLLLASDAFEVISHGPHCANYNIFMFEEE